MNSSPNSAPTSNNFRREVQMLQDATASMGAVQAVAHLDSLLCASDASKHDAIRFVRDRIQHQLNLWSKTQNTPPPANLRANEERCPGCGCWEVLPPPPADLPEDSLVLCKDCRDWQARRALLAQPDSLRYAESPEL